ncbi:MAG TPA: hypothetical protein VEV61_04650, partial [Streptosporangiaceae bacterium]|nr:hypothetical protein [Streptosporangiaceae bacterium]
MTDGRAANRRDAFSAAVLKRGGMITAQGAVRLTQLLPRGTGGLAIASIEGTETRASAAMAAATACCAGDEPR